MRRFAHRVDQLPVWAFVTGAMLAFGLARASRMFALLRQSRGGMEFGSIVTLAVFLMIVIFAVRRRQEAAWRSAVHVLGATIAGNALGIVLIWPFVPDSYAVALVPMLQDALAAGLWMAVVSLPLAVAMLWLSRRFGSHSQLTERRMRVVREQWRLRLGRTGSPGRWSADSASARPEQVHQTSPDRDAEQ